MKKISLLLLLTICLSIVAQAQQKNKPVYIPFKSQDRECPAQGVKQESNNKFLLASITQDPILPECQPNGCTTCESCMHDTALWLGDKCVYAVTHCSPCQSVVDFWCSGFASRLKIKMHI